ncbi:hypothetical protein LPJ56_000071 [Coemansia sp. RSA 2599]|nr:hypothetical protein LPJ75_002729 [Coemansia sp. RSA 2598]KAJ1829759.1 hypothetical protein LPJ56_000071 [Coemansia sp. RSA 2599]
MKRRSRTRTVQDKFEKINATNELLYRDSMVSYAVMMDNIAGMLEEKEILRQLVFNPRHPMLDSTETNASSTAVNSVSNMETASSPIASNKNLCSQKRLSGFVTKQPDNSASKLHAVPAVPGKCNNVETVLSQFFSASTDSVSDIFVRETDDKSLSSAGFGASSTAISGFSEDNEFDLIDLSDAESVCTSFSNPLIDISSENDSDSCAQSTVRKTLSLEVVNNKLAIVEKLVVEKNKALARATVCANRNRCIVT